MPTDRKTIQIASRRFRTAASNLYSCDFADYNIRVERLLSCMESEPCINEFVDKCVTAAAFRQEYISGELDEVRGSWSNTFDNHANERSQAAFVYLMLKAMLAEGKDIVKNYGAGYARSKHFQDWADAFTKRFVSTLIDAINARLEEQLILSSEMDDVAPKIAIHGNQAQVNIADRGSHIESSIAYQDDLSKLEGLLNGLLYELKNTLGFNEYLEAEELAETIKEEAMKNQPKKGVLKASLSALKGMASAANLTAAVLTIEEAAQHLLG